MMPVLQKELHLDYQDLGHITGALALAMGAAALFTGNLADRIGFRPVVISANILSEKSWNPLGLLGRLRSLITGTAPCSS